MVRYGVVRDMNTKTFVKWHETQEDAVGEAARLCKKEGLPFIVVKEVGTVIVEERPIVFVEAK